MIFRSLLSIIILTSIFLSTSHFHINDDCHVEHNQQESYKSECNICNHNLVRTKLDFKIKQTTYFSRIFMLQPPPETHELIFLVSDLSARSPPFSII